MSNDAVVLHRWLYLTFISFVVGSVEADKELLTHDSLSHGKNGKSEAATYRSLVHVNNDRSGRDKFSGNNLWVREAHPRGTYGVRYLSYSRNISL